MKYLDDLFYWVGERERIRIAKDRGQQRPWTSDPVLQQYRFCNVHRDDDKVTQWIHNNWMWINAHSSKLPFAMAVARMVNLPETLEQLGFPDKWDPEHFIATIDRIKREGKKAWTSAYMITGGYSAGGEAKEVIIARVLGALSEQLHVTPIRQGDTLELAAAKLRVPGIGTFLSAQIVADLKHVEPLSEAKDWITWCAPGPVGCCGAG